MSYKPNEPGRYRLPKEIVDRWDTEGYGEATTREVYHILWWIADMGYSIVPDDVVDP